MKATCVTWVLVVCLAASSPLMGSDRNAGVSVWLTNHDKSALFERQRSTLRFGKPEAQHPTIEVDESKLFQTIDGFGFALTGGSAQLLMRMNATERAALLRELFVPDGRGIGVSYLRISIGSSDMNEHVFTYDDIPSGQTDTALSHFSLDPDQADIIPVLKEILALNPRLKILGSPWSAPAWMKTNGEVKGGKLKPEYYSVYARYFVKYVEGMAKEGIKIDAITVQNEPLNEKNTPSLLMLAPEEGAFIKDDLGPAFRTAGLTTKIILYDHNCDVPEYPMSILEDAEAAKFVDGSGFHLYGGKIDALSTVHDAFPAKNLYFTEQMVVDGKDKAVIDIASPVKNLIIGAARNWSRNVLFWNLAADPEFKPHTDNGGCPVCQGAITIDGNRVVRNTAYYAMAHASKFVRPGSQRIGSTNVDGLPNVAFRTPAGRKVLVVVNGGQSTQNFNIRDGNQSVSASLMPGAAATYIW